MTAIDAGYDSQGVFSVEISTQLELADLINEKLAVFRGKYA